MKKIALAFTASILLISSVAFAKEKKPNPAEITFEKIFRGASNLKWTEGKEFLTASFVLDNVQVLAFFDHSGALIGTARNVLYNQLPLVVKNEINSRYVSNDIYDIVEYTVDSETFYQMTIETTTKKLKVKVSISGSSSIVESLKK